MHHLVLLIVKILKIQKSKNLLILTRFHPLNLVSNVVSFTRVLTHKMKLGLDNVAINFIFIF